MIYLCRADTDPHRTRRRLERDVVSGRPGPIRWIFLGRNYQRLVEWETALGAGFQRVSYAERFQTLARAWREPYLQWIARLGARHDGLAWWSSRLAERNTLLDSLYHAVCYLAVGAETAGTTSPLLVVAGQVSVLRGLARNLPAGTPCRWIAPRCPGSGHLAWLGRLAAMCSRDFADGARAMWDARRTRSGEAAVPEGPGHRRIFIRTYIDETYFGADGTARDRYFPGLAEALRQDGYEVITVPWLTQPRRSRREAFAWFRRHPGQYLIPEDFYSLADYLWATSVIVRQARLASGPHVFEGLDVTSLVRDACRQQSTEAGLTRSVLYYRLVEKWARLGLKFDVFIDTFENMLGEKPPVMALRRWMPDVLTVGFQHYAGQHPLMLCLFTTPEEAAFAPHPDVIVCNSPLTAAQLVEAGFPPRKLRVGPSLRFLDSVPAEVERTPEPESVLVVLAMDPMASRELLSKLLAAFPEDEGIRFWVKPHPMMSLKQFAALLGGRPLPPHMTRVEGPMSDWLARATVAVVVATTAALEVALAAIPVVLVGRETDFDQNPLDGFTGFERPVYAAATLRTRVHEKLALAPEDALRLQEWARRVRRECLSPLNERTLSAFVRRGGVEDPVAACAASGECVGAVPSHSRPVEDR